MFTGIANERAGFGDRRRHCCGAIWDGWRSACSVEVARIWEVESYDTVWQMTSTIRAQARSDIGLFELSVALFPRGSVTGAPMGLVSPAP
ncbi:MAG TPA: hypothetical protein EYQ31_18630 [Candidatus Handelsmanbacteria bacterium]|nr:hypothetical protein [Candidatus Handelsmanbacteria bacterium]